VFPQEKYKMSSGKYVPPNRRGTNNSAPGDPTRAKPERPERTTRSSNQDNRRSAQDNRSNQDSRFSNQDNRQKTTTGFSNGDIRSRPKSSNGRRNNRRGQHRDLSLEADAELEMELFGSVSDQVAVGINFSEYDKIPVDVSGVDCPAPIDSFDELLAGSTLLDNINLCKFASPTPIQKYSIPTVLANRDLMACAQTGSGKTGAFLIPTVEMLLRNLNDAPPPGRGGSRQKFLPRALILAPTRELAQQIHMQARKLMYRTGMRAVCIYGGADIYAQFQELYGGVDILVATPGRLWDMYERGRLSLSHIKFLIMDEADRMLDMGFEPQIRQIVSATDMPGPTDFIQRRTLMFSATFPDEIQGLAQDFLHDYIFLAVGRVGSTTALITQRLKYCHDDNKTPELLDMIPKMDGNILVFTATKRQADNVEYILRNQGFAAITIHGNKSQEEREFALQQFRDGECNILVATDVASRGLDIPNVLWVVQYDLPGNIDDYVHRIGRTGRRGNCGTAIGFANEGNRSIFPPLLQLLQESKQEVPSWFTKMVAEAQNHRSGFRSGGRSGGRKGKGSHFGGRDVRAPQGPPKSQKSKTTQRKKGGFSNDGW